MNKQRGIQIHRRLVMRIALAVFLMGLVGTITGVFIFRNVLRPSQTAGYQYLPFMDVFLYRPPKVTPCLLRCHQQASFQ